MDLVEMKVDHGLLNPEFDGYKLSLESVPCYVSKLPDGSKFQVKVDEKFQSSYFMAKLLASQNALVYNKHSEVTYLLENDGGSVWQVNDHTNECGNPEIQLVWAAPEESNEDSKQPHYTASLSFPTKDKAVYSNGSGELYILDTKSHPWTTLHYKKVLESGRPFIIASSTLSSDENSLHILCHGIDDGSGDQSKPSNAVEWLIFNIASFEPKRSRRYAFTGEIDHLEVTSSGMHYMGDDKPFSLVDDSNGVVDDDVAKMAQEESKKELPKFFWMQGVEDIVIWITVPAKVNKREIKVTFKPSSMSVVIRGESMMDGKLWNVIDSDSLTWTIEADKKLLEITMSKANTGMIWQRFMKEGLDGEEVNSPEMVTRFIAEFEEDSNANSISNTIYNSQELEECDGNSDKSRVYLHFSNEEKNIQRVNVSDRQVIFLNHGLVCLRHDVDGLVWQPKTTEDGGFAFEHVDTFDALGYVQASKTQRRYTVCSPKRSYVAIIDCTRHVYIYKKPEPISKECELRNRKSGRNVERIAKQHVWTIEEQASDCHVIGASAMENVLMVATTRNIYCLKIN